MMFLFYNERYSSFDFQLISENSLLCKIMCTEAMGKLEGMESTDRERLRPQLVYGFKVLSQRLKVFL